MGAPLFNALPISRISYLGRFSLVEVSLYGFNYDDSPMPALWRADAISCKVPCRVLFCGSYSLPGVHLVANYNPGGIYPDVLGFERQSHGPDFLLEGR